MALPLFRIKTGIHDGTNAGDTDVTIYKTGDVLQARSSKEVAFFRKYPDKFEELVPGVNAALNIKPSKGRKTLIEGGEVVKAPQVNEINEGKDVEEAGDGVNWSEITRMTVDELRQLASDNEIDLGDAENKLDILKVLKTAIG